MTTPFRTVTMQKGENIRVMRDGRQVAIIKPRQVRAGELDLIRELIEGKSDGRE